MNINKNTMEATQPDRPTQIGRALDIGRLAALDIPDFAPVYGGMRGRTMGLHRTDIALCLYWTFHAADRGLAPPPIRGYRRDQGHTTDKIMRVINAFHKYQTETTGTEPMHAASLKERKAAIQKADA